MHEITDCEPFDSVVSRLLWSTPLASSEPWNLFGRSSHSVPPGVQKGCRCIPGQTE